MRNKFVLIFISLFASILLINLISACISYPHIEKDKNCKFDVVFYNDNETQILNVLNENKINCSFSDSDILKLTEYIKNGYSAKVETDKEYQKFLEDAKKQNEGKGCGSYYKAVARKDRWTIYLTDLKEKNEKGEICPLPNCAGVVATIVWNDLLEINKSDNDFCVKDSDCKVRFSACSCSNVCILKINDNNIDCARACQKKESNLSITSCICENSKCVGKIFGGEDKVKILPETASLRARERLGGLGFNITLKEVGINNNVRSIYEARAKKEGKLFGFIKVNVDVSAEIDAETGEVTKVNKPWWGLLAGI